MSVAITRALVNDFLEIEKILSRAGLSNDLSRCRYVFKACLHSNIVGAIGIEFWGKYVSLRALVVDKEFKRQGIGKKLVDRAVDLCRKSSTEGVYAYTLFWNIHFFSSCGFEHVPKNLAPEEVKQSAEFHVPRYKYCCLMQYKED